MMNTQSQSLDTSCLHDGTVTEQESLLSAILEKSRDVNQRSDIVNNDVLDELIAFWLNKRAKQDQDSRRLCTFCLRCIANFFSEHNEIRDRFLETPHCIEMLNDEIVHINSTSTSSNDVPVIAIKLAYNLCYEYEKARRALLNAGIDQAIINHIYLLAAIDDEDTLEVALDLLGDITQHLTKSEIVNEYNQDFISKIFRLPFLEPIAIDGLDDIIVAISPYFTFADFQQAVLTTNQIEAAFESLSKIAFLATGSVKDKSEYKFANVISRMLTEISTLSNFPDSFSQQSSKFIITLCDNSVLTENSSDSSIISICACIMLGNYATNPTARTEMIKLLKFNAIYDEICIKAYKRSHVENTSLDAVTSYLYAIGGLLRHLAISSTDNNNHFHNPECRQAALALIQYPHVEVQIGGTRLMRQILVNDVDAVKHVITSSYHVSLLKLFNSEQVDKRLKLEISRTIILLLRNISSCTDDEKTLFISSEGLIDALIYMLREPGQSLAQAEGWLGLFLFLRCSETSSRIIVDAMQSSLGDENGLLSILRKQICTASVLSTPDVNDIGTDLPVNDISSLSLSSSADDGSSQGNTLVSHARDNAIIFTSQVLKLDILDDEVRGVLDGIITDAGITLRD